MICFQFRPFREKNVENNSKSWKPVNKLERGKVYVEVSYSDRKKCFFY